MSEELKTTNEELEKDSTLAGDKTENNPEKKTITLDEKQLAEREERAAKSMIKSMAAQAGLDEAGVQKLLDDYKAKKDAEKTDAQREKERADKLDAELAELKNKSTVLTAGVDPEFVDFVAFQASKSVSETTDFASALKAFLDKNPKYSGGSTQQQPGAGGFKQGGTGQTLSGVEEAFLKRNPGLKI